MHKKQQLEELRKRDLTESYTIEGVGIVEVYGEWDYQGIIKLLLQSETITGN